MFNWKNFILTSCCISAFFSCGKAPADTETGGGVLEDVTIIAPGESGLKKLSVSFTPGTDSEAQDSIIALGAGWVRVPEFPVIESGDSLIVSTRVFINYEPTQNMVEYISLYCDYTSVKMITADASLPVNDQYNHYFKGCFEDVDQDGDAEEINFVPGDEVGIEAGKKVSLKVSATDSSDELSISSSFELEYR